MYTLSNLQKELERARDNLREVDDYIQKVDGKPVITPSPRFSKQERTGRFVTQQPWNEEPPLNRRRPFSSVPDSGSPPRKRHVTAASDDDTSPVRRKVFPSVVGQVKLSELSADLKRGRERHQHESLREERRPRRSVFARLSGPPMDEGEEDNDDEIILKRQPVLSSRVFSINQPTPAPPTPSREQVLASQTKDEVLQQRNRRMFGALVGTLQQFRREETQDKEREVRRQQIEKKLEEDALREKERLLQEKRALLQERKKRESDIKRIEWSLNRVKEYAAWETSVLPLRNFIQTASLPHIFYLPKTHNQQSIEKLETSKKQVQDMIDKRLADLNEEIESSERKANRVGMDGVDDTTNDVNKENFCEENPEPSDVKEDIDEQNNDEEEFEEEPVWEEASRGIDEDAAENATDHVVPTIDDKLDDEDKGDMTSADHEEEKLNETTSPDGVPLDQQETCQADEEAKPDVEVNVPEPEQSPIKTAVEKSPPVFIPIPAETVPISEAAVTPKRDSGKRSLSRSSRSKTPVKTAKSKSKSPKKSSPAPKKLKVRSRTRSRSRGKSPDKRRRRSRSRSSSRRVEKTTRKLRRSRSRSTSRRRLARPRRDSPVRRTRRSRSRSTSRRRPRPRRSRSRSIDRRRRSPRRGSPKRPARRRSPSPRTRKRSRSSSSSSSSSSDSD